MKQLMDYLPKYFPGFSSFVPRRTVKISFRQKEIAGIWKGCLNMPEKASQTILFVLKDGGRFYVCVSPFNNDSFESTGTWQINGKYFSAAFSGATSQWIFKGMLDEKNKMIQGDISIEGDLFEIIESEKCSGMFVLER